MSDFMRFMKNNKKVRENTKYAATASLTDENGNPLEWEIRPITTAENEAFRESCMTEIPVPGKKGITRSRLNTKEYTLKLLTASVVTPNLNDADLQDSYDVHCAEDLITEMIDNPGEYDKFGNFVLEFNGFTTLDNQVEAAKN